MSLFEELRQKREEILAIAAEHGVQNVRVFGSVARHEETAESDIDFIVRMEKERSFLDLIGFQQDTEELLGKKTDVISERGLHPVIGPRILQEATPL